MSVSKEELLHVAQLADLKIKEDEVDEYLKNLEDILNYVEVIEKVTTENLKETIGANDNANMFRKDEVKTFENRDLLLANAPATESDMFKIPKVIQ